MFPNPAIFSYVAFLYLVLRRLIAKHKATPAFEYFRTKIINNMSYVNLTRLMPLIQSTLKTKYGYKFKRVY